MVNMKNWKDIVIDSKDPIARDFEVRYKGKKILAKTILVILDLDKKEFVEIE